MSDERCEHGVALRGQCSACTYQQLHAEAEAENNVLRATITSLKKQLEDEKYDHAQMENALARARLKAENEARELRQLTTALKSPKPESQIQAEILADIHRCNVLRSGPMSDASLMQTAVRNAVNAAAQRFNVFNQMQAILEKK